VTQIRGELSLALIVTGGIYMSAHLPQHVPLRAGDRVLLLWCCCRRNMLSLTPLKGFKWGRSSDRGQVGLIAYVNHRRDDRVLVRAQRP